MIDRIIIKNFKSLRKVDLSLGRLNLFIGTNASGKSNFLEALRILQGIGNGYNMGEILDGKPRSATNEVWEGIRGGSAKAAIAGTEGIGEVTISAYGRLKEEPQRQWDYRIAFSPAQAWVTRERIQVETDFYESAPVSEPWHEAGELMVTYSGGCKRRILVNAFPLLGMLSPNAFHEDETHARLAASVARLLADSQTFDPSPHVLRRYSPAHAVGRMGDQGEDFAAVVRGICSDEKKKGAYLSWLRELRPEQVDDVGTLSGAVGEPMFMLIENVGEIKRRFPAPVLKPGRVHGRVDDSPAIRRSSFHGGREEDSSLGSARRGLAGNGLVSLRVLVIPEDPTFNGHLLAPLVRALMADAGRPSARVQILENPRVQGYVQADRPSVVGCRAATPGTTSGCSFPTPTAPTTTRCGDWKPSSKHRRFRCSVAPRSRKWRSTRVLPSVAICAT